MSFRELASSNQELGRSSPFSRRRNKMKMQPMLQVAVILEV